MEDAKPLAGTGRTQSQVPTSEEMLALAEVNRQRGMNRLPALRYEPRLYSAARLHSDEQLRHGYLGHDSPDPARAKLSQRMGQEGYAGRLYAEVVAMNYFDVATVVDAWMKSPAHRAVLLDPELSEGAFCRLESSDRQTNRWTGDFGAPPLLKTTALPATSSLPSGAERASIAPSAAPRSQAPAAATYPTPLATPTYPGPGNKVPAPAWNNAAELPVSAPRTAGNYAPVAPRPQQPPTQPYSFGSTSGAPTAGYVAPAPVPAPTYTQPAPAPYRPPVVIRRPVRRVGDCAT